MPARFLKAWILIGMTITLMEVVSELADAKVRDRRSDGGLRRGEEHGWEEAHFMVVAMNGGHDWEGPRECNLLALFCTSRDHVRECGDGMAGLAGNKVG